MNELSRVDERTLMILERMERLQSQQDIISQALTQLQATVIQLSSQTEVMKAAISKAEPTLQEFLEVKHKIHGAGAAGKWMWAGLAALLTWVISSKSFLASLFKD